MKRFPIVFFSCMSFTESWTKIFPTFLHWFFKRSPQRLCQILLQGQKNDRWLGPNPVMSSAQAGSCTFVVCSHRAHSMIRVIVLTKLFEMQCVWKMLLSCLHIYGAATHFISVLWLVVQLLGWCMQLSRCAPKHWYLTHVILSGTIWIHKVWERAEGAILKMTITLNHLIPSWQKWLRFQAVAVFRMIFKKTIEQV